MPAAPHRIGDSVDVEPVRQRSIVREDEAAPDDGGRRAGRLRYGGRVRKRSTHECPRQPDSGNGKKPRDADHHRWMLALCDKGAKTLEVGVNWPEVEFRRRSLERATTGGGREPAVRVGRACAARRQWETSRAALRSGIPQRMRNPTELHT